MFGLSSGSGKKSGEFFFDVELEAKDPVKGKALKDKVAARIKEIKARLRSGQEKTDFDLLGTLLHGYNALQKVLARSTK